MPIYEFYCRDCHTVFSFLSRKVNTSKRPDCPRCGRPRLPRKPSSFSVATGSRDGADESGLPDLDDHRLEQAMESLSHEMAGVDENDPRQMAQMMRKMYDATGLELGPGIREAIQRLEAGEDPEQIEQELGDQLESEDPFLGESGGPRPRLPGRRFVPPAADPTLYEL